jgi:hypothetical protein
MHLSRTGALTRLISDLLPGRSLVDIFEAVTNHDDRAALVCAITSLCVASSRYSSVGDSQGWIILPPRDYIQPWAWSLLVENAETAREFVCEDILCLNYRNQSYPTKLYLPANLGLGLNWNETAYILGRPWFSWSWQGVSPAQPPLAILAQSARPSTWPCCSRLAWSMCICMNIGDAPASVTLIGASSFNSCPISSRSVPRYDANSSVHYTVIGTLTLLAAIFFSVARRRAAAA